MKKEVIVYEASPETKLEVKVDRETVWLTQEQMCQLFGRERSVITKHIRNIFKEGELEEIVSCAKFAHDTRHGALPNKTKTSYTTLYNLDVIISVGYRVKSLQGTRFRQWATRVLREMLLRRVDDLRRIGKLENRVDAIETDIKQIKGGMSYLVEQLSPPPAEPPRRRIGFGVSSNETSQRPYGRSSEGIDKVDKVDKVGCRVDRVDKVDKIGCRVDKVDRVDRWR